MIDLIIDGKKIIKEKGIIIEDNRFMIDAEILKRYGILKENNKQYLPLKSTLEKEKWIFYFEKDTNTIIISTLKTNNIYLKVHNTINNDFESIEIEDFILGVMAAEFPENLEIETIKALTVSIRTYIAKKIIKLGGKGCSKNNKMDICNDSKCCINWVSPYDLSKDNIFKKVLPNTKGIVITYNGNLVDSVYHNSCGGHTENSENVWGNKVSYLRKVECDHCKNSTKWKEEIKLTVDDFKKRLGILKENSKCKEKDIEISGLIEGIKRFDSHRLNSVIIGGKHFKGKELIEHLRLNSTRIKWYVDQLKFISFGSGHGLGLCIQGGDGMAKEGKKYNEILDKFFTGVQIKALDYSFEKPLNNKTIVIDPGQIDSIQGNINLKVSKKLKSLITTEKGNVIMTREKDIYAPLSERVKVQDLKSVLFISINSSFVEKTELIGGELFYFPKDERCKSIADEIQSSITYHMNCMYYKSIEANLFVLRETKIPSVMVEIKLFKKDDYILNNYAKAIFNGIINYFR